MAFCKSWCALFSTVSAGAVAGSYFVAKQAKSSCTALMNGFLGEVINAEFTLPKWNITIAENTSSLLKPTDNLIPINTDQNLRFTVETPILSYSVRNLLSQAILDTLSDLPETAGNMCSIMSWISGGLLLMIVLGAGTTAIYTYHSKQDTKRDMTELSSRILRP